MIWVVVAVGIVLATALLVAVRNIALQLIDFREWSRIRSITDTAVLVKIEKRLEEIEVSLRRESDAIRHGLGISADMVNEVTKAEIKALVDVMREVVHETPDFAITGEDGEVPVRRMRGLRSALARMEELSRVAAGE